MTERSRLADDAAADESGVRTPRKPRYLTIAETLHEEIRQGTHAVGRRLPSEAALCERFTASRFTVREALRHLEDMGLLWRRRGASSTVRGAETQVHYDQHIRSVHDLTQYSQATGFQLLHTDRQHADPTIAGWLNARVGIEYVQLHGIRLQRRTQQPFCLTDVYRRASWQGLPQGYSQLEEAVRALLEEQFQQRIGKIEQSLSAVSLSDEQARELRVASGSPALRSLRRYFDAKGKLLVVVVAHHPAELYSYFTRYERSDLALHL
jgi:GntR family transcriptional regulator